MGMRLILTTGGTGGHIFPALAVAEALRRHEPDVDILFVGGLYGPEGDLARSAGINFHGLDVRGVVGRGTRAVKAMAGMGKSVFLASRLVSRFQPDAVMGFGGYAAFATVFAAWTHGRPTGIHEQNAYPGVTNRVLARLVRRICLSWPRNGNVFPEKKCVLTGNPVREAITETYLHPKKSRPHPRLLVLGGSQGARAVNSWVVTHLATFRDAGIDIVHQTGKADLERIRAAYLSHGYSGEDVEEKVVPFITDMANAYSTADLALCRAGATTLAELAASGTPSILVPFPYAAHDHQAKNALVMQDAGGAVLALEKELDKRNIQSLILELIRDSGKLGIMSENAHKLAMPDAAANVAREIRKLAANRTEHNG